MKKIMPVIALMLAINLAPNAAQAQIKKSKEKLTPATHMFIRTALNSVIHIPITSLEQCEILTRQASLINSSTANCFYQEQLLKSYACQKPVTQNGRVECQ